MRAPTFLILAWTLGSPALVAAQAPPAGFAGAIDAEISSQEKLFVDMAEAMPPEKFDFGPEKLNLAGSEFKGTRTFGQQVRHVAADNFAIWAPVLGEPEPPGLNAPNGPAEMTSRAEILKFLRDSYTFAHRAAAKLTSENALGLVEFRGRKVTRVSLVVLALTHVSDHYGQMAEYLRMCGVVPPASRPRSMPMPAKSGGG